MKSEIVSVGMRAELFEQIRDHFTGLLSAEIPLRGQGETPAETVARWKQHRPHFASICATAGVSHKRIMEDRALFDKWAEVIEAINVALGNERLWRDVMGLAHAGGKEGLRRVA